MGRHIDPDSQYRIKLHIVKGYKYASTQPHIIDVTTQDLTKKRVKISIDKRGKTL